MVPFSRCNDLYIVTSELFVCHRLLRFGWSIFLVFASTALSWYNLAVNCPTPAWKLGHYLRTWLRISSEFGFEAKFWRHFRIQFNWFLTRGRFYLRSYFDRTSQAGSFTLSWYNPCFVFRCKALLSDTWKMAAHQEDSLILIILLK